MNPAPRPLQGGFFNGYFFLEFRCRDFQKKFIAHKDIVYYLFDMRYIQNTKHSL